MSDLIFDDRDVAVSSKFEKFFSTPAPQMKNDLHIEEPLIADTDDEPLVVDDSIELEEFTQGQVDQIYNIMSQILLTQQENQRLLQKLNRSVIQKIIDWVCSLFIEMHRLTLGIFGI